MMARQCSSACFLLTFGQLAAPVMIVGISNSTTPTENVKSFLKDLCEKYEFDMSELQH